MGFLRKPSLPPVFAALAVLAVLGAGAACAGPPAAAPVRSVVAVGDLVCLQEDDAPDGSRSSASLPGQCPVLVVGMDAKAGMLRVLGSHPWDYRVPAAMARPYGKAALPGTLLGATERTLDRMVPSPNAGVLKSGESFGLLIAREGRVDTLAADEWGNLHRGSMACAGLAACLDSLRTMPLHGLLQGPFLPRISFPVPPGDIATFAQGRPGKAPQAKGAGSFTALARPSPGSYGKAGPVGAGTVPDWIWGLATFPADGDTGRQAWVWSVGRGKPKVLRVAPGDPFEVLSLEAKDLDRDGFPDLIAETVSYYGDGTSSELHVFHGHPDSATPGYAVLSLSGSSGEPGGSDVAVDWWAAPPRLYRATAAKGNDGTPKATHDLRIQAYDYTRTGSLEPAIDKAFSVTVFGTPGSRSSADSLAKRMAEAGKERIAVRPLPRVVGGRILWQAGAVAPDAATAKRWARRDRSGKVLRIPAG